MQKIKEIFKTYHGLPKEVYIISLARFINAAGLFIFPLLTLLLTKKIGISESETGFWIAVSGVSSIPVSILGGKMTDIIGRKKLVIYPSIIGSVLFGACAFIEPSMLMVYLIIIAGTVLHSSRPALNSLIGDITTPENRNESFSLSYLGNNLGFAFGPFIGGLLFANHLKLFFLIDAGTTLMSAVLMLLFIEETFFKAKENTTREKEKAVKGSAFSVLLKRPILILFSLLLLGYHFAYSQWSFLMPIHLESLFVNEGAKLFGMLSSFNGIIVIIFTAIITNLSSEVSNLKKCFIAGLLYALGFGLLGFMEVKLAFVASIFIFTIGEILMVISSMPFISNHTPVSHRGRINSVINVIGGFGFLVGPIVVGNLLEIIAISTTWKIVSFVALVSTIGMYFLEIYERNSKKVEKKLKEAK